MYDHNVPRCTTEHLRRVLGEIDATPLTAEAAAMKARIKAELQRRAKGGESTVKTYKQ